MVKDPGNQHAVLVQTVEYAMAAIHYAAYAGSVLGSLLTNQWEFLKSGQNAANSPLIGVRGIIAEPFRAVGVDFSQVDLCSLAQSDVRHAGLCAAKLCPR